MTAEPMLLINEDQNSQKTKKIDPRISREKSEFAVE